MTAQVLFAVLAVGSWNLRWFPSGRAEHRASERVERANLMDAAETIAAHVPARSVLFVQELRDAQTASNLVLAIRRDHPRAPAFAVASCSAFRERDRRLGWQQCAIATDLPVLDAGWSYWKKSGQIQAPRGYAYALVDAGEDGLVACFCIHLKSNYGAMTPEAREANRRKREICAEQLVQDMKKKTRAPDGRPVSGFLVAGDFNADAFAKQFAGERTFALLADAGFVNCWDGVPLKERGTHPGNTRYPDSTLDYVFARGFSGFASRALAPETPVSDHRLAVVTCRASGSSAD